MKICRTLALLCLSVAGILPAWAAPVFDDYPARAYNGPLLKADVDSNRRSQNYRTTILNASAEAPNFAGHYHIAVWGCGIDCINQWRDRSRQ